MTLLTDTAPEVERLMFDVYRRMTPARKWMNLRDDFRMTRALHAAGMRHRNPNATLAEIQADWIQSLLGYPCPVPIPELLMEPVNQEYQPVLRFTLRTLDRLGIAYAIGGSVASSFHGASRMTRDADLTVEPFPTKEDLFISAFPSSEFYLSPIAVRDALRTHSTFNILHPATGYKIDLFVRKDEPFELMAFARRGQYQLPDAPAEPVHFYSPEDTILFKLRWYRLTNETSERQWTDVLNLIKTLQDRLDIAYLDHWAIEIGVKDLLDRVRQQAGI
ncbi:MAG TPA: hypothetical protein VG097_17440 [Gemmata sp.]|jgi:hypothetical protein|nr:hypothetical protein [Gemmata sp.]